MPIRFRITLVLTAFVSLMLAISASAQNDAEISGQKDEERLSPIEEKVSSEAELKALERNIEEITERRARLRAEISALDKDRASINRALIVSAGNAKGLEDKITEANQRLTVLEEERSTLQVDLNDRRALLAQVLGALQRMGRNPPPAILVRPKDAVQSIRSAILLGAVLPTMQGQAEELIGKLQALSRISTEISSERKQLSDQLNQLAEDEIRLTLLQEQKTKLVQESRTALNNEQEVAEDLARKAGNLKDLIDQLENQIESAAKAAESARKADERRRKEEEKRLANARKAIENGETPVRRFSKQQRRDALDPTFGDNGRTEPAIAFEAARGLLPVPVSGTQVLAFADRLASGSTSPTSAWQTRANAIVRSPADAWVIYAGPFRSYGILVILNAGNGYRIVLSGLEETSVRSGQFLLTGEPIGRMGLKQAPAAALLDLPSAQPVLYVEFRKDRKPVDPAPWWSNTVAEGSNKQGSGNDS